MMEKGFQAVVLLLISSFPVTEADSCTSGEVKIDTTCPTNCSQEPPRIPGDRVFFKCSIGGQKAVDRYKETHKKDFLPESAVFDAPKVRGVELYWKSYDDGSHFELALKVNFSLPKGILVKSLPKAILLKFESIPGPYEDCYYVENPREKIYEFEFHPIHAYDMVHPRRLQEDCLVGLDHMKAVLVYNITLQTAEGTLASYITTVHVRDTSPRIWKPVIMAFLNETNASLFVVVEKPPSSHNIQSYNVSLVDGQNKISRSVEIKVHDVNTTAFVNLSNFSGQYRIMVRPLCKGNCNRKIDVPTLSYRIVLPGDPGNIKDTPDYLDDSLKPVKVVAIVMGCTFGVLLVLTIICFIHQRPKRKGSSPGIRPYCLLLHPLEKECVAVIKLKEYISQTCDCKITDCMDLYQKSAGETERMTANRARSYLRDATVFLVLYASDFYNSNATSFHTDFLSCFINSAINRRQKHNDLRIILLQFPFVTNSELPPLLTKNNIQLLELTNSPDKLYSKLHGLDKVPLNGEDLSTRHNHSQWREVVAALKNNVRREQNNASTSQGEAEPLLTEKNLQIGHEELDEGELLAEIAKINLDSDSVIGGSDGESPRQMLGLPTNKKIKTTAETSIKAKSEHLDKYDYHANCLDRFNVNVCEAEVHPMPTRTAVGYGDQPFSSPPVFTSGRRRCIPPHSLPVCTNRYIDDRNVDGCPTNYMPHISHEIVDQNPLNHGFHGGHHYQPGLHHAVFPNHHQYHRQIYTDDLQYSAKHLNEACGQNMNDFKEDQRQCERNQSFNAHDPHVTKPIGPSACLDVNTKHELTKQNTEDLLAVRSLVPSLPTDLGIGAVHDADVYNNFDPPDDLHRDSPQLLHESEFGSWESSLMDLFVEFNKNNI